MPLRKYSENSFFLLEISRRKSLATRSIVFLVPRGERDLLAVRVGVPGWGAVHPPLGPRDKAGVQHSLQFQLELELAQLYPTLLMLNNYGSKI